MKPLRIALLGLVLVALAVPTAANAERGKVKRCEGIGETITKLRSKGQSCDDARTLAAMWADTADGRGRVEQVHGYRCVRNDTPGPGGSVQCGKNDGAKVVKFRYRLLF